MKARYLFILVLPALLIAAWLARVPIAEWSAEYLLRSSGMSNTQVEIDRVNTKRLHIARVAFSFRTESDVFRLEARGGEIAYHLRELFSGRVGDVAVDSLAVSHDGHGARSDSADDGAGPVDPVAAIAAMKRLLRESLAVESVVVRRLVLEGETFGVLDDRSLRLQASNEDSVLKAVVSVAERSSAQKTEFSRELVFTTITPDHLSAQLDFPQRHGPKPVELELVIHEQRIEGSFTVQPGALREWLLPLVSVPAFGDTEKTTGTIALDFATADRIGATVTLATDRFSYAGYRADGAALRLVATGPADQPFARVHVDNGSYIRVERFEQESFTVTDLRIGLVGDLVQAMSGWRFEGRATAPVVEAGYDARSVRFSKVDTGIAVDGNGLNLSGGLSMADVPGAFAFTLGHRFADASGSLALTPKRPIDLSGEGDRLSRLWSPWPYAFDLLKGEVTLASEAKWSENQDFMLDARVQIEHAAGHYGEIVFAGLSLEHRLDILPSLRSAAPGDVNLAELDSGVVARNIRTQLSLGPADTGPLPRVTAHDLYGEIFDGSFGGDEILFDLNRDTNRFAIKVEDIDLAAIVATQQFEDIDVTGRIDGNIPVKVSEEGVFIEDGVFISDVKAGTIRYTPGAGSERLKQNPLTSTALVALKDFRYSDLEADVNFRPDGTLTVNVKLKGTSPELDTNRPVHLNINTEQNLLSLLKSLRYAESAGAGIEQKVRDKYRQTRGRKEDQP